MSNKVQKAANSAKKPTEDAIAAFEAQNDFALSRLTGAV